MNAGCMLPSHWSVVTLRVESCVETSGYLCISVGGTLFDFMHLHNLPTDLMRRKFGLK